MAFRYMRRLLFSLIVFSLSFAQQAGKDSVLNEIARGTKDSTHVMNLYRYGQFFDFSEPDSAIFYYKQARRLADALGFVRGQIMYSDYMAAPLDFLGRYDEKDSLIHRDLELCYTYKLRRAIAAKYNGLANSATFQRDNIRAVEYYLKALEIAEEINDSTFLAAFHNNLSAAHKNLGQDDKAYAYGEKALAIHKARGRKAGMINAYINLGLLDTRRGDYTRGLSQYFEALRLGEELEDNETRIICYNNIADCYIKLNRPTDALRYYTTSDSMCGVLEAPFYHFFALAGLGRSHMLLGNLKTAQTYFERALERAERAENNGQLMEIHHLFSELYQRLGNYRAALTSYKKYEEMRDSVSGKELREHANELEVRYRTAKQEKALLRKTLELQQVEQEAFVRTILLGGVGLLAVTLAIVFVQRNRMHKHNLLALARENELSIRMARMEERMRIAEDMHDDLGAGLTSIKLLSEVALQKPGGHDAREEIGKISRLAGALVDVLSEIVWAMRSANDSLDNLLGYIRAYAAGFLADAGMTCRAEFPEIIPQVPLSGDFRRNLFLVVKEALNNIVKHSGATEVVLGCEFIGEQCRISIRDNGKSEGAAPQQGHGFGLSTMSDRMQKVGGTFSFERNGGTTVRLSFPIAAGSSIS